MLNKFRLIQFSIVLILFSFEAPRSQESHLYPVSIGGKSGYIDQNGKIVIEPQFLSADTFSQGLAAVCLEANINKVNGITVEWPLRRWGYINPSGHIIFTITADWVGAFSDDRAYVVKDSNTIGYCNTQGKLIVIKNGITGEGFSEGLARVMVKDKSTPFLGNWGFINRLGHWVIKPAYVGTSSFSNGLAVIIVNKKEGFIDKTGELVIPPKFNEAWTFLDDITLVHEGGERNEYGEYHGGRWRYIDKTGKYVLNDTMSYIPKQAFSEGLAAVEFKNKKGMVGFINKNGDMVIEPRFMKVNGFHNGLSIAWDEMGDAGVIDKTGKFLFRGKYRYIEDFSGPLARAIIYDESGNEQGGYIDLTGKMIFKDDFKLPPPIP